MSKRCSWETEADQDAYELTRTFKKQLKLSRSNHKVRKHSEQIETLPYGMVNLNKLKMRSPQHHSSTSKGSFFKKVNHKKGKKSKSKSKIVPKTARKNQLSPDTDHNFLSPEVVKHESSYCFENHE